VKAKRRGVVYLVGAGPGDPELLTVRASHLLASCEVLAHDELVSEAILSLTPRGAERIRVGRRARGVRHHDARIHPLVIERALDGLDVVRLKGGDPMVFGRGGEEIDELRAAGIAFEVVPGITAALGAAAALAFPLTHRDSAHAVTLRAARTAKSSSKLSGEETLVYYMGLAELETTCRELVAAGHWKSTPALVVSSATRPEQRHVLGTLANVCQRARSERLESPALLFVGEVVSRASLVTSRAPTLRLARTG
jgi:uroporphyrin-III C-methyltransferase/precorrin-2 dehydrogenase/sirohydrochlorin ferrochelatase